MSNLVVRSVCDTLYSPFIVSFRHRWRGQRPSLTFEKRVFPIAVESYLDGVLTDEWTA